MIEEAGVVWTGPPGGRGPHPKGYCTFDITDFSEISQYFCILSTQQLRNGRHMDKEIDDWCDDGDTFLTKDEISFWELIAYLLL